MLATAQECRQPRAAQSRPLRAQAVNPRLRKLRDGLNELGLPTDELLTHGMPRLVYGLSLVSNLREYLLGIDRQPRYLLPQTAPRRITAQIIQWWRERWVLSRIARDDVLDRMATHTLTHPIRHAARVPLPPADPDQLTLFRDE